MTPVALVDGAWFAQWEAGIPAQSLAESPAGPR